MEAPPEEPDAVLSFGCCCVQLLGRAVAACTRATDSSEEAETLPKVRIDLVQTPETPSDLLLKVCDEGLGLPENETALRALFSGLHQVLSSPAVRRNELLLKTTCSKESLVRHYRLVAFPSGEPNLLIMPGPSEAKPPGWHMAGTQASITFDTTLLAAVDAVGVAEQIVCMLRTLCPPVQLTFQIQNVTLPSEQGSNSQATLNVPTSCLICTFGSDGDASAEERGLITQGERLHTSLIQEFSVEEQGNTSSQADTSVHESILTFAGVGGLGAGSAAEAPRGRKWGALAGLVLQIPDHAQHAQHAAASMHQQLQQQQQQQHQASLQQQQLPAENLSTPNESADGREDEQHPLAPTPEGQITLPIYYFKDYTLQLEGTERQAAAEAVQRCSWAAHGFDYVGLEATCAGPMQLTVRCAQPKSGASLVALVVHVQSTGGGGGRKGEYQTVPTKVAKRQEAIIIKAAVEGALAHLKEQCPAVMAGRRERSLSRAIPLVADAIAGILLRSTAEGLLENACAALDTDPFNLADTLEATLGGVVESLLDDRENAGVMMG